MKTKAIHRLPRVLAVLGILITMGLASGLAHTDIYVSTNGNHSSGADWATAYTNIQYALDLATSNATIYLAGQTFALTNQLVWTNSFITMQGGYAATNAAEQPGASDPAQWPTVLERTGADDHRILFVENIEAGRLQNVTLRNGYLYGTVYGGGLYVKNSSGLVLNGCIVENNKLNHGNNQDPKGAGISFVNSHAVVTNCHVRNNETIGGGNSWNGSGRGGGIYAEGGSVSVVSSVVSSNRAYSIGRQGGFGGGLYLNGAGDSPHSIRHCRLFGNSADGIHNTYPNAGCPGNGGALYMTGTDVAIVENCVISNNYAFVQGGGVTMAGGTLRNSLVCHNTSDGWDTYKRVYGGGGVQVVGANSRLVNLTVVDNTSIAPKSVAGVNLTAGYLSNSIVYHNTQKYLYDDVRRNLPSSGGTVAHCIAWPRPAGVGNTAAAPEWIDRGKRNYRLRPGSPALDAGITQDWMTASVDVAAEHPRTVGASVDIGAYEADFDDDRLIANFTADRTQGLDALDVTFTAHIAGTHTNSAIYRWDFDNDGVFDREGTDQRIVMHSYGPASFLDVRLQVENATSDIAQSLKPDYIRVESSAIHVSLAGDGSNGLDWSRAYTNLQEALDHAGLGNTILVAGGTYPVAEELVLAGHSNVTIRGGYAGTGAPGANDTAQWPTIMAATGQNRVLLLENALHVVLEGVTVTGGESYSSTEPMYGGGMFVLDSDARLVNCLLSNNQVRAAGNHYAWGGGLYAEDSEIEALHTRFVGNVAKNNSIHNNNRTLGGGLAASFSTINIQNCEFLHNDSDGVGHHGAWGGALYLADGEGLVRNTLFVGNRARPRSGGRGYIGRGGAIYLTDGTLLENVTVAGNQVWNSGTHAYDSTAGGIYAAGGVISNSIVFHNREQVAEVTSDLMAEAAVAIAYTCASELTNGVNNTLASDPLFVDPDAGNYRLSDASLCIDAGANAAWMLEASDLDGNKRILNGRKVHPRRVDLGAYEFVPPAGTLIMLR